MTWRDFQNSFCVTWLDAHSIQIAPKEIKRCVLGIPNISPPSYEDDSKYLALLPLFQSCPCCLLAAVSPQTPLWRTTSWPMELLVPGQTQRNPHRTHSSHNYIGTGDLTIWKIGANGCLVVRLQGNVLVVPRTFCYLDTLSPINK